MRLFIAYLQHICNTFATQQKVDNVELIPTNAYLKIENMPAIGFEIKRKCKVCGKVFLAKTLDCQYCSPKCSKVAWKRKKDAKEKNKRLTQMAQLIPDIREYVSVKEAVAMFGVERTTLYRLIKNGTIPAVNIGKRLTRIKRSVLDSVFMTRQESIVETEKANTKEIQHGFRGLSYH